MSLVKVQNRALKKLMMPISPCQLPDMDYSPGKDGMAARLYTCSCANDNNLFNAGAKVCVSRLNKRSLYLRSTAPLDLQSSYELALQGFYVLGGYLTPIRSEIKKNESKKENQYCYQFHSNTWLTDDQLMRLAVDFE